MPIKDKHGFIVGLEPDEIFVYGSNLAGRNGAGAAKTAQQLFGARYGVGEGINESCYAIPTKDENLRVRSLADIQISVDKFLQYASEHLNRLFLVTPIGTGYAGYSHEDIAPMFRNAPINCVLPNEWQNLIIC
jgi:hypothetical protein